MGKSERAFRDRLRKFDKRLDLVYLGESRWRITMKGLSVMETRRLDSSVFRTLQKWDTRKHGPTSKRIDADNRRMEESARRSSQNNVEAASLELADSQIIKSLPSVRGFRNRTNASLQG